MWETGSNTLRSPEEWRIGWDKYTDWSPSQRAELPKTQMCSMAFAVCSAATEDEK
jgi:hypothetical protein